MRKIKNWPSLCILLLTVLLLGFTTSCQKDQLVSGSTVSLYNETDSLQFDEVFTTQPQPTQQVKIFNGSEGTVSINNIKLAGGSKSPFKINVNGQAGTDFSNLNLAKNDSLYVFVTVTLPEHDKDTPFDVLDSIEYQYGNKTGKIILSATGINAFYLPGGNISHDTTWTDQRPIVISGNITVAEGATLQIKPGAQIYTKAGKGILINGRLEALGSADSAAQILMTGSRLDAPYNNMPGSWQGLNFGPSSKNNHLTFVHLYNAVNAISDTDKPISGFNVLTTSAISLNNCIIMQSAKEALLFRHSSATISNCLIYNSGMAIRAMGGSYSLQYLTLAGYSNDYIYHTNPLLYLADHNGQGNQDPLLLSATNCIITGDNDALDELAVDNVYNQFTLSFQNDLIKAVNLPSIGTFTNCLLNVDPAFTLVDNRSSTYDFQPLSISSVIASAKPIQGITADLLGRLRDPSAPTIGCYEFKEATTP
ncbi:hypothetical protein [Arachidicoccus rhizosphaerae]|uniref:hypothetical protein n=1 Tax=Arachidicoccus rhizosphaerae TaxID=551991 RepID=UPI001114037E|nr:hypothetical protein [Arachidicoccus rhizosphaerae]